MFTTRRLGDSTTSLLFSRRGHHQESDGKKSREEARARCATEGRVRRNRSLFIDDALYTRIVRNHAHLLKWVYT